MPSSNSSDPVAGRIAVASTRSPAGQLVGRAQHGVAVRGPDGAIGVHLSPAQSSIRSTAPLGSTTCPGGSWVASRLQQQHHLMGR